ncbi:MAG TPA: CoA ester lyase [Arenicellales bacterium]|nr:CoA ester lyase [Pseudomonadales bacterium]MDP7315375.1 CoA ester lyase [Pseudomonadales bacterium]MDP7450906.1 CoA ester lyase [Arenicellales bacterium]HJL52815.1 CoA ester lyase [Arenicellales bacterium]HJP52328.1 CoA ester lyase [Pseudomonadales bacterium]
MRSMLFLPADSEKKIAKGEGTNSDGLILDLEDSIAPGRKAEGRRLAREYLESHPITDRKQKLMVRINPLDGDMTLDDLAAVVGGAPDFVILPKYRTREDVIRLDHYLSALEIREGVTLGYIKILVIGTETGQALFNLGGLTDCSSRLAYVSWGEFDLSADVGAETHRLPDGSWDDLFRTARSLCVAAAASAGIEPCNTVFTDFKDDDGLRSACEGARRAGFTCMMAIHPNQVDIINEAFSITAEQLVWSQRVVDAFDSNPKVGVVGLDGIMLDKPHYTQAKRMIERAAMYR